MRPIPRKGKRAPKVGLSARSKKIALGVLGAIVVIVGCWWAYYEFTTIPAPDLATAKSDDVVHFLGSRRGFARLSVDERQGFLVRTVQRFSEGEAREQFAASLNQMSSGQRQVFIDSVFEVSKVRAMEQARAFKAVSKKSRRQRVDFLDNAICKFERMRQPLKSSPARAGAGGAAAPMPSLGAVFKNDLPKGSDELMKVVVSRTSAKQRAEIKPFVDAVASRYKELKDSGQLEELLASAQKGS